MENVIVIGGGVAGMTAAASLARKGYGVHLIEKKNELGGNVAAWDRLFPEGRHAVDVLRHLRDGVAGVEVRTGVSILQMDRGAGEFSVRLSDGTTAHGEAVVVASGFFPLRRPSERGVRIRDIRQCLYFGRSGSDVLGREGPYPRRESPASGGVRALRGKPGRKDRQPVLLQGVLRDGGQAGQRDQAALSRGGDVLFLHGPSDVRPAFRGHVLQCPDALRGAFRAGKVVRSSRRYGKNAWC